MAFALDIRGLCKSFDRPAVDGLDLDVRAGEFYALLGPNGAGKTTTLRMVAGLLQPDAGTISIFGIDALRRSGRGQAHHGLGLGRADDLRQAHALRISRIRRRPVEHRRRASPRRARSELIGLARPRRRTRTSAARASPRACGRRWRSPARWCTTRALIILDEPLTGLDAGSARQVKDVLRERVARRRHRDHDHAHPRSRRAHGRPHRRHRRRPADRRRHARRAARAGRPAATPASKTCSSRWSPSRQPPREPPAPSPGSRTTSCASPGATGSSMLTAGQARGARASLRSRSRHSLVFMHLARLVFRRRATRMIERRRPTSRTLVVITGMRAAVLVADDVAGDGIGDARLLCALRPRPDPLLAGRGAKGVRGAHRRHGALDDR